MRPAFVLALLLTLASLPLPAQDLGLTVEAAKPKPPVGSPVQPGIWKLDGTDPNLPQADLEPLKTVLGKATIVGLGESIHTSGGFYEAKHRIFRFLVQKMGFRVLAIENPWLDVERANQYVQTCAGTPEDAIAGFFGVWRSAELRDLVKWMCDWNRSHKKPKDRLSLVGFDIQWQAQQDSAFLTAFLGRLGIAADPRTAGLAQCGAVESTFQRREVVPAVPFQACDEAARQVAQIFAADPQAIVRQTSKGDFELAKIHLVGLQSWLEEMFHYNSDFPRSFAARDRGMAYVFGAFRALRFPKSKIAVWAHNVHLAKNAPNGYFILTMGTLLGETYKSAYKNVALTSHQVSIEWPGIGCGPTDPPGIGSVENRLHALGHDFLLVDLAFPGTGTPFLAPGANYTFGWDPIVPRHHYDAVFYLGESRKMAPLAWMPCR